MKQNAAPIYLCLLFILLANACTLQPEDDPYNFNFTRKTQFAWSVNGIRAIDWDTTQTISGKQPFLLRKNLEILNRGWNWHTTSLWQRIILPRPAGESISITIRSHCGPMARAMFYINRYDHRMNPIGQDSINLNTVDGWYTHTLTLEPSPVQVLDISFLVTAPDKSALYQKYDDKSYKQFLALDKMEIKIGRKNISARPPVAARELSRPVALDSARIIPFGPDTLKTSLPLKNKKILALGETLHFNDELTRMALETIKDRIKNGNCRLVMLEMPYNIGYLLNYYASGAPLTDQYTRVMSSLGAMTLTPRHYAFFDWLRQYNQNRERKVLLLGIDIFHKDIFRPELEVLNAAAPTRAQQKMIAGICDDIANSRYKKLHQEIDAHAPMLTTLLGEENYRLFRYHLEWNQQWLDWEYTTGKRETEIDYLLLIRDQAQYNMARTYLAAFLEPHETACLYAHFGHVAKAPTSKFFPPLGHYLSQEYGAGYCPLALVVAGGQSTMRTLSGNGYQTYFLTTPPPNSIELAAEQHSSRCFAYLFDEKNDPFAFIRSIGTVSHLEQINKFDQFQTLISPNGLCDGFIYAPQGRPMLPDTTKEQKFRKESDTYLYKHMSNYMKKEKKK